MEESTALITSPLGVTTVLFAICAFYFYLEKWTEWKLFNFFPPLIWIYATPVVLGNLDILGGLDPVLPSSSAAYSGLRAYALPVFIVLMLMYVNVPAAVRVMGKGVLVMLLGTAGIVVGGVVSFAIVSPWLSENAWTGYGALTGSWIGGTGNMAAAAEALGTPPEEFGLAVIADNLVYIVWLPILLGSKAFADKFNKWAGVPEDRVRMMEEAAAAENLEERPNVFQDYLFLGVVALAVTWFAARLAEALPELQPILSTSTWNILLVTTFALVLSITPLRRIPGGRAVATAIIYVFVASMGARAELSGLAQAPAFVAGAFIWIAIHGAFILAGAWFLKVDVHSAAIASAANVGGAASAPVVAAYHRESLVPVSILMALIGYALGNYLAILTGQLCRIVGGG
ncbi:MAG: DUF819 family protein [Xanthomonadales bacterium]|nr:DUF819 family protein [Xanthomonadales bacterium]